MSGAGSSGSLVTRLLDFQFNLGTSPTTGQQQTFVEGGTQLYLSGLRASADIEIAGAFAMGGAEIAIYGMTFSQMSQLTTLGFLPIVIGRNVITVFAYTSGTAPTQIYQGTIKSAWMDASDPANVAFRVSVNAGLYQAVAPVTPHTYAGKVSAVSIMQELAGEMGMQFTNNGVNAFISDQYTYGSGRNQFLAVAKAANCNVDFEQSSITVWPKGQSRDSTTIDMNRDTGMIGFPTFTSIGVIIKSIFNPLIKYGTTLNVTSKIQQATAQWVVASLSHNLDTLTPHGNWFSEITAQRPGYTATIGPIQPVSP